MKEPQVMDEEDESFFVSKEKPDQSSAQKLNGGALGAGATISGRPLFGPWSGPALLVLLALLGLTVWSLPAPTLLGKLGLLRQSWRLNAVLDESAKLRDNIAAATKEMANMQDAMSTEQARAMDLQRRLDSSAGETKSLRTQLAQETSKSSLLHVSNQDLEVQIKRERDRRKELLQKLQVLKHAELKELAGLDAATPVAGPSLSAGTSATGLEGFSVGTAGGSSVGIPAAMPFGTGLGDGFGVASAAASPLTGLRGTSLTSKATAVMTKPVGSAWGS